MHPYAQKVAFAFLHKELTDSLPRKFKIAFSGCKEDCMVGAIHDVGLRAVIRDGQRGFRMVVGGGLGPLPVEAHLLDEFVPEERLVSRSAKPCSGVFNKHGNRKNKNKARLKFVVRERGLDWVKEQIEKELPGHPGQWRHRDAGGGPGRLWWFSISHHHRSAPARVASRF